MLTEHYFSDYLQTMSKEISYSEKIDPIIYNSGIETKLEFIDLALAAIDQANGEKELVKILEEFREEVQESA